MRVRHVLTGKEGYVKVYTWWQGHDIQVFTDEGMVIWKQEHVELVSDRPVVRSQSVVKKKSKDVFEGYTENELDELYETMSGKEFFMSILRSIFNFFSWS